MNADKNDLRVKKSDIQTKDSCFLEYKNSPSLSEIAD
jgi:hypothetical protein